MAASNQILALFVLSTVLCYCMATYNKQQMAAALLTHGYRYKLRPMQNRAANDMTKREAETEDQDEPAALAIGNLGYRPGGFPAGYVQVAKEEEIRQQRRK
jgi:hypothetical protein